MTYPSLARDEARMGANLLASVSNDAWYGRAGAQAQHLLAMPLRAVEVGRPFARAAITGISAAVDSRGRMLASSAGEPGGNRRGDVAPRNGKHRLVALGRRRLSGGRGRLGALHGNLRLRARKTTEFETERPMTKRDDLLSDLDSTAARLSALRGYL